MLIVSLLPLRIVHTSSGRADVAVRVAPVENASLGQGVASPGSASPGPSPAASPATPSARKRRGKATRGVLARLPATFTPREALEEHCDLNVPPKKAFLRALAECCSSMRCSAKEQERDRNRLLLLSGNSVRRAFGLGAARARIDRASARQSAPSLPHSRSLTSPVSFFLSVHQANSKEIFRRVVEAQGLSLIELLEMFPSCQPPLALLLTMLPPMQVRLFYILIDR